MFYLSKRDELGSLPVNIRVSIIIPHYNGDILLECLSSLFEHTTGSFEVIVVDDGSTDGSVDRAQAHFPAIRVLRNAHNRGLAVSCNRGFAAAQGHYLLLLNNDVEVQPGWLEELVRFADAHPRCAACQPKILSAQDRSRFDYAGAAGGRIDEFGHTYCLGRLFDTLEEDRGQYDTPREIFWASGAALLLRRESLEQVGYLDELFFMHFEEIDLCWRLHLAGFQVWSVPSSTIYHHSGWTLPPESPRKMFLNHRNNLLLLLKNYALSSLLWAFPIRLGLEGLTILYALFRGDLKRAVAALKGMVWVAGHVRQIARRRATAQAVRRVSDREIRRRMTRGSIALRYFLGGSG